MKKPMSSLWTKKSRTLLRNIKPGDIFCFTRDNENYYFGQILSETLIGHIAEIFKLTTNHLSFTSEDLDHTPLTNPIVLDSYSLFDKKTDETADWRIVGHQEIFEPKRLEKYFFVYGSMQNWTKLSALNAKEEASELDALRLPPLTPLNNYKIWRLIESLNYQDKT